MKNAPCKGCEKRDVKCHSTCEEYKAWKSAIDAEKEATKTDRIADGQWKDFREESFRRNMKRRGL